jgi:hypothetical protein
VPFEEHEWDFVRTWTRGHHELLLTLLSSSDGALPDEQLPLLELMLVTGEALLSQEIRTISRFADDPRIELVKRLGIPWRYVGDTVDSVKIGKRVVGDYDDPAGPRPATWARVPAASAAVEKLKRLVHATGSVSYKYGKPQNYITF